VHFLIGRYLVLLQRAVDAYPIFGAKAFLDAQQDASGPLAYAWFLSDKPDVAGNKGSGSINSTR